MALRRAYPKPKASAREAANDDRTEGDVYARQYYTAGRPDSEVNKPANQPVKSPNTLDTHNPTNHGLGVKGLR